MISHRNRIRPSADPRALVKVIEKARSAAMSVTFREEIGAAVRSASPFLISLLAIE